MRLIQCEYYAFIIILKEFVRALQLCLSRSGKSISNRGVKKLFF